MMVPGTMKTLVSDRDIFNLYQNHINIAFSFGGKGYIFVNGITSNGKPMEAVFVCNTIVRNINSLSRDYKKCDAAFLCLDKNNRLMIVITIEKITGERKDIDIISGQEIFI